MDGDSTRLLIIFIVCVILSAYFSSSESSFMTMNKIRIKQKADDGNKKAKNALYISNNYDKAITTLLIGNNIVNIAASSVATLLALKLFEGSGFSSESINILTTVVTTVIIFLLGEMLPKSYALDRCDTTAMRFSGSMRFLMKLFRPLSFLFNGITNLISKLFKSEELPSITEDELKDIITTAEEEGVVDEEQSDLLMSAIQFSGTTAGNVMTSRDQIVAVSADISSSELLSLIQSSNHSRLPVYEGDIDHIIGYLQIRTYLREYLKNPEVDIRELLIPPFFVSPHAKIDDLLTVMRQHKFYMAVVSELPESDEISEAAETGEMPATDTTEPGERTLGIVTIEDFLEELVGDIWDESDEIDHTFTKLGGNKYRIDTHMSVAEAFSRMNCPEPETRIAKIPVLAWIVQEFKHIPQLDESFKYGNMEITVDEIEGHRVSYVTVKIDVTPAPEPVEKDSDDTLDSVDAKEPEPDTTDSTESPSSDETEVGKEVSV